MLTSAPIISPPLGRFIDFAQGQPGNIDQVLGAGDVFLHQIQQIRTAGDEMRRRASEMDGVLSPNPVWL